MTAVQLAGIQKSYGRVDVVRGLDLEIRERELLVLVGPSGCGKSTVLRMIAGLEEISGGTLSIGDAVVNDVAAKDRDVAMVFQNYALYPHMTVRENLAFGLKMRKVDTAEMERRVESAVSSLGLDPLLDRKPKQLSGGQRQRVALGRAIVRKPKVFLFDEPLSNLDASLRLQTRTEIAKLQRRLQTTTVYVTHDQVEAMTLGDRIAILKDGDLQQLGTPLEIYEKPANAFVATFIGTPPMSLLNVRISEGGDRLEMLGAELGTELPVPVAWQRTAREAAGRHVHLGIRPENLIAGEPAGRGTTATIRCEVEGVELLGHEVLVHGRLGGNHLVAKAAPQSKPEVGQTLDLVAEMDFMHLFDAETGHRLIQAND